MRLLTIMAKNYLWAQYNLCPANAPGPGLARISHPSPEIVTSDSDCSAGLRTGCRAGLPARTSP